MAWDALTAFGSIAGALILLIGSVAAIVQIKHLRVANQLECYLHLMEKIHAPEMVDARKYIETTDFTDPQALQAATTPDLDSRIRMVGTHFQTVARLLNQGVLEEQLFAAHIVTAPHIWNAIEPAVEIARKRAKNPMFIDFQYLVYRLPHDPTVTKLLRRYPADFVQSAGLDGYGA